MRQREIIRKNVPKAVFHVFNWTFISFIQSILLFLLAAPAYILLLATKFEPDLSSADVAYVAIELGLILTEYLADEQQWGKNLYLLCFLWNRHWLGPSGLIAYQEAKREYQKSAKVPQGFKQSELDRGFIASGLWGYSRHPNFAAEQSIWFFLYQWSCYATRNLYSWTAFGPSFLVLLFQGSTWLTELVTAGKYPEFSDYQSHVGMFVPKRFSAYKAPVIKPKIIRTSELAKKQKQKQKWGVNG
jgi:steroid 5-alpha reductase family enzyme